jgi:hypothetical protein
MEEHGAEFESVTRQVLGRRRQCKWRQRHALAERTEDLRTMFDSEWEPHRNALFTLWSRCFPGVPPPTLGTHDSGSPSPVIGRPTASNGDGDGMGAAASVQQPSWTALGFPDEIPHTLFGSTGVLGIKHLLFYAETRADTVHAILESDLQLAVLGITVTQALALLGFDAGQHREPLPIAKPEEGPSHLPLERMLHNVADPTALEQVHRLVLDATVEELRLHHGSRMTAHPGVVLQVRQCPRRSHDYCTTVLPLPLTWLTVLSWEGPFFVILPLRAVLTLCVRYAGRFSGVCRGVWTSCPRQSRNSP